VVQRIGWSLKPTDAGLERTRRRDKTVRMHVIWFCRSPRNLISTGFHSAAITSIVRLRWGSGCLRHLFSHSGKRVPPVSLSGVNIFPEDLTLPAACITDSAVATRGWGSTARSRRTGTRRIGAKLISGSTAVGQDRPRFHERNLTRRRTVERRDDVHPHQPSRFHRRAG
jgi:hypothetical protein